ncbi:hypothetical protein DEO72_LG5g2469 [Vigna unguiculata]|uniref:Uncharacterized protein n=1 Tax=Vigna unguiculata TaxID=3917 RepID=A0A4D6M2G8_VIGUN|nr:hypothetical protein DEO72_LG5g2469 [Vigna unguiculata]
MLFLSYRSMRHLFKCSKLEVKSDFTRYWYGGEKHLDETWIQTFLYDHYAKLMPACVIYSNAQSLSLESSAVELAAMHESNRYEISINLSCRNLTRLNSFVKSDFTRYWYGGEKHLDETWIQTFLYDHELHET